MFIIGIAGLLLVLVILILINPAPIDPATYTPPQAQ